MRICILTSRFYPHLVGSGTSAYNIALNLSKRGHSVIVLTDSQLEPAHELILFPFAVRYVPDLEKYATGKAGMKKPLESVYSIIKSTRPDVIHVFNFMPMHLIDILKPSIICPVIFTFFNTPELGKRAIGYSSNPEIDLGLASHIIKSRGYDKLVLNSKHYVSAARHLGAAEGDIEFTYLGVDEDTFLNYKPAARGQLFKKYLDNQIAEEDNYLILPSRVTEQKGIAEAVEALPLVLKSHQVKLLITGMANPFDGAYAESVMDLADELGVKDKLVVPVEHIERGDLPHFFAHAKLTLVPSHYEGLGMSAIESQLIGVPLVASDTSGLNEVVSDNHNGLATKPRDPGSIADAITRILDDSDLAGRLVRNAKQTSSQFSLKSHIDHLEKIYRTSTEEASHE